MGTNFRRTRSEFSKEFEAIHHELSAITFGLYTSSEIRRLSAAEVTNPLSFNQLGHPLSGGLYDLRLGPFSDRGDSVCETCLLGSEHCPGHLGHISLPLPVFNPLFYSVISKLLKMSCIFCHEFKIPPLFKILFIVQQKLLNHGLIVEASEASEMIFKDKSLGKEDKEESSFFKNEKMMTEEMILKLNEFMESKLQKSVGEFKNTRSIESQRRSLNRQFFTDYTKTNMCLNCKGVMKKLVNYKSRFIYEGSANPSDDTTLKKKKSTNNKCELNPQEVRAHFRKLWTNDFELLQNLFPMLQIKENYPMDVFFIDVLAIPPPKTRPCQYTGGTMNLHPQSVSLTSVLETTVIMKQLLQVVQGVDLDSLSKDAQSMIKSLQGETHLMQMDYIWKELQSHVNSVLDREMNYSSFKGSGGNGWGFKQLIERKQGLFRMHMMGKRVNYAARTVITPDPNICIDEVGVPEVFAKKLTYKVPVTHWNVQELRKMVVNGPDIHPGAVFVESEAGNKKMIDGKNLVQREALAKTLLTPDDSETKFVYRHLVTGDSLLMNRQPTLHRPSIMCHRARVLKGEKVMRLHYAICKSYNADFDGDEMNAHFPQNEVARSEAVHLVNVCHQYLVPKDGTPLQGLIQDHIIAGVKMTIRGRFFTRSQYQQHVYSALVNKVGKIHLLPPSVLKPKIRWSGKQIISTIVLNLIPSSKKPLSLNSKAKIGSHEWIGSTPRKWKTQNTSHKHSDTMCESNVIFSQGELVCGIMDKNQYGATNYSLVHGFYELYGGLYSAALLSAFSKIFTSFLHTEGFTLGVEDILVTKSANEKRKIIMEEISELGVLCASNGVTLMDDADLEVKLEEFHRESKTLPRKRLEIDRAYKDKLAPANNKINSTCLPKGLLKKFPYNNLQLMVQAGAKGSSVNTMQISCLLGQIELEGKRPPLMISGKSLPSFPPYDTSPRSGGFIDGRFMSGIKPQEFFFHCMAGREGLIDTAVKTSRSGYLQRCLIKLLEGLVVNYDLTVRDSDGSVIQFQYGEDSLDISKCQYLIDKQLPFLQSNIDVLEKENKERIQNTCMKNYEVITKTKKAINKALKKERKLRDSPFLKFCRSIENSSVKSFTNGIYGRSQKSQELLHEWKECNQNIYKIKNIPDPIESVYRPDSNYGAINEKMDAMINSYLKLISKPEERERFRDALYCKYMSSIVNAGEPVGVIAAQSIGEPSTQMTLNTFHFAGRGEMNVTLGIPRLREILMVASENIKTPSLTLPFHSNVSVKKQEKLRLSMNRVKVSDVLETVEVSERVSLDSHRSRIVKLKFIFLPRRAYKHNFCVTPQKILQYFESKFVSKVLFPVLSSVFHDKKVSILETETRNSQVKSKNSRDEGEDSTAHDKVEKGGVGEEHASSDEEELHDDADASESRKKLRQNDEDYDEGLSDEEIALQSQLEEDKDVEENELESKEIENEGIIVKNEDHSTIAPETHISIQRRRSGVLGKLQGKTGGIVSFLDYNYDSEKELWSELTLSFPIGCKNLDMSNIVKIAASKGIIHEIKSINRAILTKNNRDEPCLTTDGVNIEAMYRYDDLLDLNRLSCNHIHEMAKYYGIEAANKTIATEIINVFEGYGINVNMRHLTLIADYMTFDGKYRPFNRVGIESNASPLQQMTFETAIGFLRSATLDGKIDSLESPSACIVAGKPCYGGTRAFNVLQKLV